MAVPGIDIIIIIIKEALHSRGNISLLQLKAN